MTTGLRAKLNLFDPRLPLEKAHTIPSLWYRDPEIYAAQPLGFQEYIKPPLGEIASIGRAAPKAPQPWFRTTTKNRTGPPRPVHRRKVNGER